MKKGLSPLVWRQPFCVCWMFYGMCLRLPCSVVPYNSAANNVVSVIREARGQGTNHLG
jgi:hypothetical protein